MEPAPTANNPSQNIIEINNLTKTFGKVKALDNFDLTVKPGQVHGFLGPNGAGKSTTLRIILGLLRPNSGEVRLFDHDAWQHSVGLHRRLAYVPAGVQLWPNLTGGEAIDLLTDLRGHVDRARRDELIAKFKLDPTKKCRAYSTGNSQKVAIIAALASDVELYIFDEPTAGLDPLMQAVFNEYVRDLKRRGKTILLSSHILDEVQALCDTVTIIKDGRAITSGTLADLRGLTRLNVRVETVQTPTGLEKFPELSEVATSDNQLSFKVEPGQMKAVMKHLATFEILTINSEPPTLEELFLRLYEDEPIARTAEEPAQS